MALETFKNMASTTLNGGINNSTTSIVVTDGSVFPSTGNFRVLIGSEIMLCTARSSNTLTVTRAQESTSAASHSDLDPVYGALTAGGFDQMFADLNQSGAIASLPTASKNGPLYLTTDTEYAMRDNGSSFSYHSSRLWKLTPPVLGDFTWTNQGSVTTDTTKGGIRFTVPSDSGFSFRVLYKAKTAPYKITAYMILHNYGLSYHSCGMGFYDGTGGRFQLMHFITFDNDWCYVEVMNCPNTGAFNNAPAAWYLTKTGHRVGWMQIENDNTNLYYRISPDGQNWFTVYSASKTAYLANAPNRACFYVRNNTGSTAHQVDLLSWKEE